MNYLENPVVLITGGNKGIGKATCELFSRNKSTVIFTTRNQSSIPSLEDEFKKMGAIESKGYLFDVRNPDQSKELINKINSDYGRVDVLVNNAGIGIFKSISEMSHEEWNSVINTNLTGLFYLTKEILPLMISQKKGHIVNVGSLASRNTFAGGGAYCASKFALLGFSECLMLDVRHHNIKVSIIMPGSVNTPFNDHIQESDDETWKLTAMDVAEAIYDVVNTRSGHLMSRVEIRPLLPNKK